MKRYIYSDIGPLSAISFTDEHGDCVTKQLHPGKEITLPEGDARVKRLVFNKLLTPVKQGKKEKK